MTNQLGEARTEHVIRLCQDLIRTRSYSGEESSVAALLKEFFLKNGYDDAYADAYGNMIGIIEGSGPGPTIVFDGYEVCSRLHGCSRGVFRQGYRKEICRTDLCGRDCP